jgi:hypothetical protein
MDAVSNTAAWHELFVNWLKAGTAAAAVPSRTLPPRCRPKTAVIQDPFSPSDTRGAIEKQVANIPAQARIAVNLTGGTKLMFPGAPGRLPGARA